METTLVESMTEETMATETVVMKTIHTRNFETFETFETRSRAHAMLRPAYLIPNHGVQSRGSGQYSVCCVRNSAKTGASKVNRLATGATDRPEPGHLIYAPVWLGLWDSGTRNP